MQVTMQVTMQVLNKSDNHKVFSYNCYFLLNLL